MGLDPQSLDNPKQGHTSVTFWVEALPKAKIAGKKKLLYVQAAQVYTEIVDSVLAWTRSLASSARRTYSSNYI